MWKGPAELRRVIAIGARPAEPAYVRSLAVFLIAIGVLAAYLAVFPLIEDSPTPRNVATVAGLLTVGAVLLLAATRMKVWMLHAVLSLAILAVLARLLRVDTVVGSAVVLSVITWCSVLIGVICSKPSARVYLTLMVVGSGISFTINPADSPVGVWLAFAVGYIVVSGVLSAMSSKLRHDAVTDSLTGLSNRKGLLEAGAIVASVATRTGQPLTAVQIDLENFKAVNDREGHERGDQVLCDCADAWSGQIRAGDVLARSGGDEFTLLLAGTDSTGAQQTLDRLRTVSPVGWSAGVAELRHDENFIECIRRADITLLSAKAGRDSPTLRRTHTGETSGEIRLLTVERA